MSSLSLPTPANPSQRTIDLTLLGESIPGELLGDSLRFKDGQAI
jgi:hypothetical protein